MMISKMINNHYHRYKSSHYYLVASRCRVHHFHNHQLADLLGGLLDGLLGRDHLYQVYRQ